MACTLSEAAERRLLQHKPDLQKLPANDVVIIGCGGQRVNPKWCMNLNSQFMPVQWLFQF